jgi:integrase
MKVRRRVYGSGRVRWQLDAGIREGKRVQRIFETKAEALEEMARMREDARDHGDALSVLSPRDRQELVLAWFRARDAGLDLREVVEAGLRAIGVKPGITLEAAITGVLAEKRRLGVSAEWLKTLESLLQSLGRWPSGTGKTLGMSQLREVRRELVVEWLEGNGWAPRTKNGYLSGVRTLTSWAVDAGHLEKCPLGAVGRWKEVKAEVKRLSVEQCAELLAACRREDPELLGYVALGLFGGVRWKECRRLVWADWHAERSEVVVAAGKAKTRQRRVFVLPSPGPEWLALAYEAAGRVRVEKVALADRPICPGNFERRWDAVRAAAGLLEDWPEDGLRHTAATMHYAAWGDEKGVQAMLGHRSADMLHQHYRALATKGEALRFYGLSPGNLD